MPLLQLELPQRATPEFDGATFDPALDHDRLARQLGRVWDAMRDGQWRSLAAVAAQTGDPEASVSARLRDLRKPKFGGYTVRRRRFFASAGSSNGLWEYRLEGA